MIKINLGCGKRNFGEGWWHVDGSIYPYIDSNDIYLYKFQKDTVDLIYASHFLEYFDKQHALDLLKIWLHKLKPGGLIRLAVPDFEIMMRLYIDGEYNLQAFLGPIYGKMQACEDTIFHKTGYDFSTLKEFLELAGFIDVRRYDWRDTEHSHIDDHSQAYLPHMDKDNGTLISLNVEANKRE